MIILDTHAWLWWMNESNKLSVKALEAINSADLIGIPAINCWEIAMLVEKSRIGLSSVLPCVPLMVRSHPDIGEGSPSRCFG
ncbi:PIN domain-containing protein [Pseudanabaena sp. FACHB-1277]|uniref:PIN domain-containing protein n=1 Tax=Pseudanabaena cinerea FACHB-1277 TaxID=2949581 RepID=A0A926UW78_9CYAN|nr:PIN domain-containing protein [Pseudanabaena cinerea]MBD2152366.1 PIN domain-containing protein [Pseudanabaena cinerea FACHB-1277]